MALQLEQLQRNTTRETPLAQIYVGIATPTPESCQHLIQLMQKMTRLLLIADRYGAITGIPAGVGLCIRGQALCLLN